MKREETRRVTAVDITVIQLPSNRQNEGDPRVAFSLVCVQSHECQLPTANYQLPTTNYQLCSVRGLCALLSMLASTSLCWQALAAVV